MRILVLMKRFGANKDMVAQDFGRQIRLFENISKRHHIDFFCPDYKKKECKNTAMHGMNFFVRPYSLLRHFSLVAELKYIIRKNEYDLIVGTTDPLLGILGYRYAKKFNIKYAYDMQDEYSSYASYRIPLIPYLEKKIIRNSDLVITVSDALNKNIKKIRKRKTVTIQNGVDPAILKARGLSRKALGLPEGKIIIYTGEISKFKGLDTLMEAFKEVIKKIKNCHLLLSGKVIDIEVVADSVIYKKYPQRHQLLSALNSADVAVLPNPKNKFSEFCFPYKLAEYMAVGLPIVATRVGDAVTILSAHSSLLCNPSDKADMAEKLILALKNTDKADYSDWMMKLNWKSLSEKLNSAIIAC